MIELMIILWLTPVVLGLSIVLYSKEETRFKMRDEWSPLWQITLIQLVPAVNWMFVYWIWSVARDIRVSMNLPNGLGGLSYREARRRSNELKKTSTSLLKSRRDKRKV